MYADSGEDPPKDGVASAHPVHSPFTTIWEAKL